MSDRQPLSVLLVLLASAGFAAGAGPEPVPKKLVKETVEKAEKAVKDHLDKLKGGYAQVKVIDDEVVVQTVPNSVCFGVLYRQFPVGRIPPAGLSVSNVFVVAHDGKVTTLTGRTALEKFFREKVPPV